MNSASHSPARVFGGLRAPDGSLVQENFERWFSQSCIVHSDGSPLVVFHGTDQAMERFESFSPTSVYQLDGVEIIRVDSWDMGEDKLGCAHGFHYGAISDALTLGPSEALEFRLNEATRHNCTRPDTLRAISDLRRMQGKQISVHSENRPSGDGFYFTPDLAYSFVRDIGKREGGNVHPVYLSIQNPIWLNASQIEGAGASYNIEKYQALGYDGAIFADFPGDLQRRGWNGSAQIVAFKAGQIKSSVGNSGMYCRAHEDTADAWAWTEFGQEDILRGLVRDRMAA